MKTYLVKFKSGTQVIVKDKDLSEATQKLGEIESLVITDIQIFETQNIQSPTNPFGYDEFFNSLEEFKKRHQPTEPTLVELPSPTTTD